MFKTALCLVALFAALTARDPVQAQPRLTIVGGDRLDFGTLYAGRGYTKIVKIRNDGDSLLAIKQVLASCGCTGTLLASGDVPPGGETTIEVSFDPTEFSGVISKDVTIRSNDPATPKKFLHIDAYVERVIDLDRNYVSFNAEVGVGQTIRVALRNSSTGRVRLGTPTSPLPELKLELLETALEPGSYTELLCTFTPAKPGVVRGVLTIPTSDPRLPSLELKVFAYGKRGSSDSGSGSGD